MNISKLFIAAALLANLSAYAAPNSYDLENGSNDRSNVSVDGNDRSNVRNLFKPFDDSFNAVRNGVSSVGSKASNIVASSLSFLGVPYRWGGTSAVTGFDCSGYVQAVYRKTLGVMLPRTAAAQAQATAHVDKSELQPGDLVFFNTMRRTFSHVGIYLGDGKFAHAPHTGSNVRVDNLNNSYWTSHFTGARRPAGDLN